MYDYTKIVCIESYRPKPYSAKAYKLDAIKAVRAFCLECFGVTPGLKITKDFVDGFDQESDYELVWRKELSKYPTSMLQKEIERRGPGF